jgi:GNAT superfamily N-acetyltransferase
MKFEIAEEPITALDGYGRIPMAFEVRSIFDVTTQTDGSGEFQLTRRMLAAPYDMKDYDAIAGEGPANWARSFDLSHWGLFGAYANEGRIGGTAIAFNTQGVSMLEGRKDLAVLWDIRVTPQAKGQGVGSTLFRAAEVWAAARGCRQLKVETQNINVPACRFYQRMGCKLGAANRGAYTEFPHEVQLLWYKDLPRTNHHDVQNPL